MRIALYARFSSERQDERSIDDQLRLCRDHAAKLGAAIAGTYADYAISGASLINRPEARRLIEDARAGKFDAILAEALDRLSRDQEDIAFIFKRLAFAGVKILTVADGEISELHIGLKGTMNALFLKDLAAKVRRGMRGRAIAGFAPGGRSYGYDVVRTLRADGEVERGRRSINEAEASVIRRIFKNYAGGLSPRAIAGALNAEKVPAPRGGHWNASTIVGNRGRAHGILLNELYRGRIVFNRVRMEKDPDSGKRVSRLNPQTEWVTTAAPDLRIVDDVLWDGAQARRRSYTAVDLPRRRRPKHLFSGLTRCGVCGAAYTVHSDGKLACTARRESGTCSNNHTLSIARLEKRVFAGIRQALLAPDQLAAFTKTYHAERRRLASITNRRRRAIAAELPSLELQIRRVVDAIAEGLATPGMKAKLIEAEAKKSALETELTAITEADSTVALHPNAVEDYRRAWDTLDALLASDSQAKAEVADVLRRIVRFIEIIPLPGRGQVEIRLHGVIEELINVGNKTGADRAISVVAGEGFEPPTSGL